MIPETYKGLPVTAIGTDAFRDCTGITSVVIPDSVTSIGGSAFRGCINITDITLPANITSIPGAMAFGCANLKYVAIPDGVNSIGGYAFSGCTNLEAAVIPDSVTNFGGSVFANCKSLIIFCEEESKSHLFAVDNGISYILQTTHTKADYVSGLIYTDIQGADINSIVICSGDVTVSTDTACAGTGVVVDVMKNGVYHTQYKLVVNGDTNGDSICDVLDCFDVERIASGHKTLAGAYSLAADNNADGIVDINDYQSISNLVLAS